MENTPLPQQTSIALICENLKEILILEENIKVLAQASYSTCLTIAAFISFKFPELGPPGCKKAPVIQASDHFPDSFLTKSLYFQPWSDYIGSILWSPTRGWVSKNNQLTTYSIFVNSQYFQELKIKNNGTLTLKKIDQFDIGNKFQIKYQNQQLIRPKNVIKRRIGVINFSASQLKTDIFKPKINLLSLYAGIWYETGDEWKLFNVLKGQIPSPEDYSQIDVLFTSGSAYSVNDEVSEINQLFDSLKKALKQNAKLKVVGLCFGHQGFAKYYGGKVEKRKLINGLQFVNLNKEVISRLAYMKDFPYSQLTLAQHHSDFVVQVPESFETFASSESCECEGMVSKDGRCISFQCHPEYSIQYNRCFAARVSSYKKGQIFSDFGLVFKQIFETQQGMKKHYQSITQLRLMIKRFVFQQAQIE